MATETKPAADKNSREYLEQQIKGGRSTVLAILLFSVINLVFLVLDTGRYFLFSASVPYYLTWFGKILDNGTMDGSGTIISTFTVTALVIAAVILALYLVCWLLSKKHRGWLTAAMVLFIVDTVALAIFAFVMLENPAGCLLDVVFHIIGIVEFAIAVSAAGKLKRLPPQIPVTPEGCQGTTPEIPE